MAHSENLIATVSTKGQIILPKTIRQRRKWEAGTRLIVEETAEGVLLRQAPAFSQTKPDDVFGMLPFSGEPKTLEDMEAGVLAEARRRDGLEFADGI
ncbi:MULTISPECIES: AbrB/MazE/SpoVT family DNA-binding domain-containing protein [Rhizobium]|uniref:AbrB/MazE/SpoVT family DNA-binding domain-containing protein n=1 Tax=Rhizobium TaxID=379 RepID=UPI0014413BEE|nr:MULTISPECIES: AbrB/MazE/SpoVT family DNA-binding domain-containing protein [Rhizobium]MBA1348671.1 AbrB/MazE/SpoVT family DNA-binding domain-containing protein [Rhizobium sp. WYCCWR 11146]NKK79476.1 AbrB family transcriptional regulator [Rhizobium leguminosarum bv. viciae]NYT30495.1 AbrB/MazE/SpoVT family DNA-binding domain-containing protein [Rhizobium sp. WYCCWR 11128]